MLAVVIISTWRYLPQGLISFLTKPASSSRGRIEKQPCCLCSELRTGSRRMCRAACGAAKIFFTHWKTLRAGSCKIGSHSNTKQLNSKQQLHLTDLMVGLVSITEPLQSRNADSTIESSRPVDECQQNLITYSSQSFQKPERKSFPKISTSKIALQLPLIGNPQHGRRDVKTNPTVALRWQQREMQLYVPNSQWKSPAPQYTPQTDHCHSQDQEDNTAHQANTKVQGRAQSFPPGVG